MGKIQILPENIRNKISAGEVVERPVSVVKELVENSIDAKAKKIIIEVNSAGEELIAVTDNGEGMTEDDAILAIKPFATSKIKTEEDLNYITTLGFRGEALSSIASVSKMELRTKTESSPGVYLRIEGGEIKDSRPWEGKVGTSIRVYDLFYNVPVRKKFLKSPLTEGRLIQEFIERISLAYPEISFQFFDDGKEKLFTSGNNNVEDVILEIFGKEVLENLIFFEKEEGNYKIYGYISKPGKLVAVRAQDIIFLNRRIIRNISISQAIKSGYKHRLREDFYPFSIINLFVPYEEVDVNVHPTKREVKFHNESKIMSFISSSIQNALEKYEENLRKIILPSKEVKEEKEEIKLDFSNKYESLSLPLKESATYVEKTPHRFYSYYDIKIIGQAFNNYLILEYKDKLLIMDQHAAHERIQYENLKKQKNTIKGNEILFPLIIKISQMEKKLLEEKKEVLEKFAFYWEEFGKDHIRIISLPKEISKLDNYSIEMFFRELIEDLGEKNLEEMEDKLIKTIACHSAIRSGEILIDEEIYALIKTIVEEKIPLACPHGRPIIWEISKEELEKKFHR
ncbi:MAG: DNA mismatch repair protein MutL [Dictyoglomus sp. NZ13-RE01]|nr:MAG: DNA mismatch repair protein MutL [Dictyoglomus sp. NZ13-RE01]